MNPSRRMAGTSGYTCGALPTPPTPPQTSWKPTKHGAASLRTSLKATEQARQAHQHRPEQGPRPSAGLIGANLVVGELILHRSKPIAFRRILYTPRKRHLSALPSSRPWNARFLLPVERMSDFAIKTRLRGVPHEKNKKKKKSIERKKRKLRRYEKLTDDIGYLLRDD